MKYSSNIIIAGLVVAVLAGLGLGYLLFHTKDATTQNEDYETKAFGETIWTCSMHPQIRQNEPGDCPICGMDLIPLSENGSSDPLVLEMTPEAIERGTKWLGDAGLRPTRQRVSLASLLVGDGQHRHVTAESLFEASLATDDKVSLATVYNTLRAFCDAGLMQEVTVDGSKSYFDTNMSDHPHFYWEDTAELTDAPADQLRFAGLPEAPEGAEISKIDVVIRLRRT